MKHWTQHLASYWTHTFALTNLHRTHANIGRILVLFLWKLLDAELCSLPCAYHWTHNIACLCAGTLDAQQCSPLCWNIGRTTVLAFVLKHWTHNSNPSAQTLDAELQCLLLKHWTQNFCSNIGRRTSMPSAQTLDAELLLKHWTQSSCCPFQCQYWTQNCCVHSSANIGRKAHFECQPMSWRTYWTQTAISFVRQHCYSLYKLNTNWLFFVKTLIHFVIIKTIKSLREFLY